MPSKIEGQKPRDRNKKGNSSRGQSCYNNKSIRIKELCAENSNKKNKNKKQKKL